MEIKFPKTLLGWKRLFWITIHRCPVCHSALCQDSPLYDDGETLYCLPCGGAILPRGFITALRWNNPKKRTDDENKSSE